ncbi:uncharacterized protein LOC121233153 isoform X2 [Aquila chrysaetos chrysaetos]|uniref:uncharacterized protein LOC121233153 isoform X2 n=1 Tax=Aquila chrysaetos chrysaetos TaxID=223781 RepID=UPI001B7D46E9|nr:uncharacterized protein LOC121233153 isoform X2 [Aquila chrysaetos chrysaetos]
MFIIVEIKVDLENPPALDVHHRGGQSAPGDPPHVGRSSSWRSKCSWRTPPCWTFIIVEVKVLLETPPMLDVQHRGGQSAAGEPPHVGRSSSWRSKCSWRTPPCWTFSIMEIKVLLENPATLDVHHRGGQSGPGEPHHVGRSSSWRSKCSWRTPPCWTFIIVEVKVDLENPPMLDVQHRGGQSAPGEPPLCWTFIIMEIKVLLENPPMLDVHHRGGQSGPGEPPPRVGRSASWRSKCSWRTSSPCWMLIIMEVKVDLEKPPMLDVDHHGGQSAPGDHPATLDVHRHGGQGAPGHWGPSLGHWGAHPTHRGTLGFLTSPHPVWLR